MLPLSQLALGFLLPAAVAAAVVLCARRPPASGEPGGGIGGLALAAGYVAGHVGLRGIGTWPPVEATGWLPYLACAAAAVGAIDRETGRGIRVARRMLGAAVIFGALALLLRARRVHAWSDGQSAAWLGGLGTALVALELVLERGLPELPRLSGWLTLVVVAGGSAAAITASGSLVLGLLGAALASACTGAAAVAVLVTSRGFERTSVPTFVVLLAALLLAAFFYSDLPGPSALLLAAALLAPRLVPRRWAARGAGRAALLHATAAAVPAGAALAAALAASPPLAPYY